MHLGGHFLEGMVGDHGVRERVRSSGFAVHLKHHYLNEADFVGN
jgi:hypothetical protein